MKFSGKLINGAAIVKADSRIIAIKPWGVSDENNLEISSKILETFAKNAGIVTYPQFSSGNKGVFNEAFVSRISKFSEWEIETEDIVNWLQYGKLAMTDSNPIRFQWSLK